MANIRPHRAADAEAIGTILADGWRQAYSGFMPESRLRTHADRAYRKTEIAEFLAEDFDPASEALLVAEAEGRVLGFAHLILEDKGDVGARGAISLLYVDPVLQGGGIGRELVVASARWFAERRIAPIAVSAFAENPFSGFYAHIGGTEAARRSHVIEGRTVEAIIFLWPDAAALERGATHGMG